MFFSVVFCFLLASRIFAPLCPSHGLCSGVTPESRIVKMDLGIGVILILKWLNRHAQYQNECY